MTAFSLIRPDDFHVHLRDGSMLEAVARYTAAQFARATIMPNLLPPVTTVEMAKAYRDRIISSLQLVERSRQRGADDAAPSEGAKRTHGEQINNFEPLMTLYLTDNTSPDEIKKAAEAGIIKGIKLYPAGSTTNSESGVTDIKRIYKTIEAAEKYKILFLVHGEVADKDVDVFDREAVFIERVLSPITDRFKSLKIVFEHVTTKQAVQFVKSGGNNIAATITPQHLLFNRNHLLAGGLRPHYYCWPILKGEEHRQALVKAALSDSGKFFAGTDSAPHLQNKKESSCGCAGCFTAPYAVELYAKLFDGAEDLSKTKTQKKFENFLSRFGAEFYNLPSNKEKITLTKTPQRIAEFVETKEGKVIPLLAGEELEWSVGNA